VLEVGTLRTRLLLASEVTQAYACIPLTHIVECRADRQVVLNEHFIPTVMHARSAGRLASFTSELLGLLHQRGEALAGRVAATGRGAAAEFADFLVVIEGAYDARVGDLLVSAIKEKLGMPIRYHAFSHLHGQYIGSTRAFVAEGATIVVPPTTAPMIEEMAAAPHALRPDRLSASPKKPSIETVKTERRIEDGTNALTIFNVVSEHTDEYFVFWFPGQKILLTGDLLFYRPGKPLTGRSKRVCLTVSERSLEPERLVATWPLDGFGTKNVVTGAEFRAACESSP
jgi:hypothetical protein